MKVNNETAHDTHALVDIVDYMSETLGIQGDYPVNFRDGRIVNWKNIFDISYLVPAGSVNWTFSSDEEGKACNSCIQEMNIRLPYLECDPDMEVRLEGKVTAIGKDLDWEYVHFDDLEESKLVVLRKLIGEIMGDILLHEFFHLVQFEEDNWFFKDYFNGDRNRIERDCWTRVRNQIEGSSIFTSNLRKKCCASLRRAPLYDLEYWERVLGPREAILHYSW
jgi:hypothetical protein